MKKYLFSSAVIAIPFTWIVDAMQYIFTDWEFAKWICVAVALDTALGIGKAFVHKDISSDEFGNKFFRKIFIYIALMILSNVFINMRVHGELVGATQWIGEYLCVFMIVREAISILENVNAILPIVPTWLLKRLKDFNDKGEYLSAKNGNSEGNKGGNDEE